MIIFCISFRWKGVFIIFIFLSTASSVSLCPYFLLILHSSHLCVGFPIIIIMFCAIFPGTLFLSLLLMYPYFRWTGFLLAILFLIPLRIFLVFCYLVNVFFARLQFAFRIFWSTDNMFYGSFSAPLTFHVPRCIAFFVSSFPSSLFFLQLLFKKLYVIILISLMNFLYSETN